MFPEVARRLRALAPAQRRRWALLPFAGLLTAALEAFAGALVFALVALLFAPDDDAPGRLAAVLQRVLPSAGAGTPALTIAAWAAIVHLARTLLTAWATWWRVRMAGRDAAALSARLLRGYLSAPWSFHLQRSSAALIERLHDSVRPFFEVFESAALIAAHGALIAGLGLVALVAAPWPVTALMAGLALTVAVVLRVARRAQLRGGARTAELGAALYRHIQHGLGAVKEITILGRGEHFARAYERDAEALASVESSRAVLEAVPRLVVETAFVLGLLALVIGATRSGDLASALPLVSLYAYAGFRAAPAAHALALQVEHLRWSMGASAALLQDLERHAPGRDAAATAGTPRRLEFHDTLRADRVWFTYPEADRPILRDVVLEIRRGESVAITGPTGVGKSTLVDVLIGLLPPSSGEVTVDGIPISTNVRGWQANVGYVPQAPFFLDDTLARNIALGVPDEDVDEQALGRAVELARLSELDARLPEGLHTRIGEGGIRLSGGERQRVAIARALYRDPALVVFDEATSSLDAVTEREIADAIDSLRGARTLIVIAHRESTVTRCDRAIELRPADATTE